MAWKIIDRILLPTAFFLIAFVAALTLWQLLINHRRTEIQAVTNEQVTFVKSKIESELRARLLPAGKPISGALVGASSRNARKRGDGVGRSCW